MPAHTLWGWRGAGFGLALLGSLLLGPGAARASAQEPTTPAATPAPAPGVRVDSVVVRGNRRVAEATVRATANLQPGTTVTAAEVQNAIRRLMASGNFSNVEITSRDATAEAVTLLVTVEERPLIAEIQFRGLERISGKTVRDTVGLKENQPLDPNRVARAEHMIRQLLARAGVQTRSVDTTLTALPRPEGAYRLTFNVREGERLSIADIDFTGNLAIGDGDLKDAIKTREEGFLWFRSGKFDRETFQEDLTDRLPGFYAGRGYIDFAVVSDTLIVDPQTGKARLRIEVSEGPQYRLGDFRIDGASHFPHEQLAQIYTSQRRSVLGLPFGRNEKRQQGEVFDRAALDAAAQRIEQMYRNEGYLYAQVAPVVKRQPGEGGAAPTVDVSLAVSERSPFYIRRVAVEGNTFTHESVIRDRVVVFPGDVYNEERLIQSYQGIAGLGFFETPLPTPDIVPDPENGTVDITFHVKEKQTGNINFGTAIGGQRGGGVSGFLGYSQPNLFGQGKQAELRVEYGSYGRNSFVASYTDPAIRGSRNSGTVSLFHTDDRYRGFSFTEGRYVRTGGSLQFGVPVPGARWTRAFLGYSLRRVRFTANEDDCDPGNIFCRPTTLESSVTASLARDTRNHPLFPSVGTRQSLALQQTGGPLGGDGNFQKLTGTAEWWVPVWRIGGGAPGSRPIQTAIGLTARTGMVAGEVANPLERFFLGGTQFGEQLRGYEENEVTPFGFCDKEGERCGLSSSQRLGDAFLTLSAEYAVRFNDNLSLSLFADAGNIWRDPQEIDPTRLFRGAGVGATIVTPFGPLGLDYAYGFDRDIPGWKLHFKLGQGF